MDRPDFPARVEAAAERLVPPETDDVSEYLDWLQGVFVYQEPHGRAVGWVVRADAVAAWVDGEVGEFWPCESRWHEASSVLMVCRSEAGEEHRLPWRVVDRDAIVHGAWPERRLERIHFALELP